MTKVRARIEGHYEVRRLPYGTDYVWAPGRALIECDCGHTMDVDARHTVCPGCGHDHATFVLAVIEAPQGEVPHPWQPAYETWRRGTRAHDEREAWAEQRDLD
jgi:hypothetical protein